MSNFNYKLAINWSIMTLSYSCYYYYKVCYNNNILLDSALFNKNRPIFDVYLIGWGYLSVLTLIINLFFHIIREEKLITI